MENEPTQDNQILSDKLLADDLDTELSLDDLPV